MSQPAPAPPPPPSMSWPAPPPPPPPSVANSGLQCPVCQRYLSWVTNERQLNLHVRLVAIIDPECSPPLQIDECLTKQFLEHEGPSKAAPVPAPAKSAGRKQLTDSDIARQLAAGAWSYPPCLTIRALSVSSSM